MRMYALFAQSAVLLGGFMSPLRAQIAPDFNTLWCYQSKSLGSNPSILVDLLLRFDGDGNRRPTGRDSAAVTGAGGRIVRAFNVGVLRARLDTTALRRLLVSHDAFVAYPVVDSTSSEVLTQVQFVRPLVDQDTAAIRRLGGRALETHHGRIINAILADSALPLVKALPGVDIVQARPTACGEWHPRRPPRAHGEFEVVTFSLTSAV